MQVTIETSRKNGKGKKDTYKKDFETIFKCTPCLTFSLNVQVIESNTISM